MALRACLSPGKAGGAQGCEQCPEETRRLRMDSGSAEETWTIPFPRSGWLLAPLPVTCPSAQTSGQRRLRDTGPSPAVGAWHLLQGHGDPRSCAQFSLELLGSSPPGAGGAPHLLQALRTPVPGETPPSSSSQPQPPSQTLELPSCTCGR